MTEAEDMNETINSNSSYEYIFEEYEMVYEIFYTINIYVLYILISIGTFGNFLLLAAFCFDRNIRTGVNIYILNTAVADIVFIACLCPLHVGEDMLEFEVRILPEMTYDKLIGNAAQSVSVFSLAALSVERYLSVRRCAKNDLRNRGQRMSWRVAVVVSIWISVTIAKATFLFSLKHFPPHPDFVISEVILGFVLPLLLIALFSALTRRILRQISGTIPGESRANQLAQLKKASRTLTLLVVNYILCFSLEYILMLYIIYSDSSLKLIIILIMLYVLSVCLRFLHSSINPLVIYCSCSKWRAAINRCLCFLPRKCQNNLSVFCKQTIE